MYCFIVFLNCLDIWSMSVYSLNKIVFPGMYIFQIYKRCAHVFQNLCFRTYDIYCSCEYTYQMMYTFNINRYFKICRYVIHSSHGDVFIWVHIHITSYEHESYAHMYNLMWMFTIFIWIYVCIYNVMWMFIVCTYYTTWYEYFLYSYKCIYVEFHHVNI